MKIQITLVALVLASGVAFAQHEHHHDEKVDAKAELGEVSFDPDCVAAASDDFNRALALMHHMMYAQAREAFAELKQAHPDCAMAHWGVATTLFQPLWGTRPSAEERQRGWDNSQRAAELAESQRERLLIRATEAYFSDPDQAEFRQRLDRWAEQMAEAHDRFPDDPDVTALHALALLTRAQNDGAALDQLHDRAEAKLRAVWERKPTHPGAIHYTIHATDVDGRARNALDMVELYGQIAPDTAHALHMPSHIYVRLGDWDEVIDWNVRSAEAALKAPVNGAVSHHFIHAIDYMVYAYLQRGEDALAERVHREANNKGEHQASFVSAFHFAAIPARLAVEQRDWQRAADLDAREPGYLPWDDAPWPESMSWFARGMGKLHQEDVAAAREALERLEALRALAEQDGESAMATYIDIDRHILEGWILALDGLPEDGVARLAQAVALETTVEKHPVTPGALYPPREALGDLLLELGRYEEALDAYRSADQIWPQRYHTHLGAARAARSANAEQAARDHYEQVLALADDSDRDGVSEARRFLAAPEA